MGGRDRDWFGWSTVEGAVSDDVAVEVVAVPAQGGAAHTIP